MAFFKKVFSDISKKVCQTVIHKIFGKLIEKVQLEQIVVNGDWSEISNIRIKKDLINKYLKNEIPLKFQKGEIEKVNVSFKNLGDFLKNDKSLAVGKKKLREQRNQIILSNMKLHFQTCETSSSYLDMTQVFVAIVKAVGNIVENKILKREKEIEEYLETENSELIEKLLKRIQIVIENFSFILKVPKKRTNIRETSIYNIILFKCPYINISNVPEFKEKVFVMSGSKCVIQVSKEKKFAKKKQDQNVTLMYLDNFQIRNSINYKVKKIITSVKLGNFAFCLTPSNIQFIYDIWNQLEQIFSTIKNLPARIPSPEKDFEEEDQDLLNQSIFEDKELIFSLTVTISKVICFLSYNEVVFNWDSIKSALPALAKSYSKIPKISRNKMFKNNKRSDFITFFVSGIKMTKTKKYQVDSIVNHFEVYESVYANTIKDVEAKISLIFTSKNESVQTSTIKPNTNNFIVLKLLKFNQIEILIDSNVMLILDLGIIHRILKLIPRKKEKEIDSIDVISNQNFEEKGIGNVEVLPIIKPKFDLKIKSAVLMILFPMKDYKFQKCNQSLIMHLDTIHLESIRNISQSIIGSLRTCKFYVFNKEENQKSKTSKRIRILELKETKFEFDSNLFSSEENIERTTSLSNSFSSSSFSNSEEFLGYQKQANYQQNGIGIGIHTIFEKIEKLRTKTFNDSDFSFFVECTKSKIALTKKNFDFLLSLGDQFIQEFIVPISKFYKSLNAKKQCPEMFKSVNLKNKPVIIDEPIFSTYLEFKELGFDFFINERAYKINLTNFSCDLSAFKEQVMSSKVPIANIKLQADTLDCFRIFQTNENQVQYHTIFKSCKKFIKDYRREKKYFLLNYNLSKEPKTSKFCSNCDLVINGILVSIEKNVPSFGDISKFFSVSEDSDFPVSLTVELFDSIFVVNKKLYISINKYNMALQHQIGGTRETKINISMEDLYFMFSLYAYDETKLLTIFKNSKFERFNSFLIQDGIGFVVVGSIKDQVSINSQSLPNMNSPNGNPKKIIRISTDKPNTKIEFKLCWNTLKLLINFFKDLGSIEKQEKNQEDEMSDWEIIGEDKEDQSKGSDHKKRKISRNFKDFASESIVDVGIDEFVVLDYPKRKTEKSEEFKNLSVVSDYFDSEVFVSNKEKKKKKESFKLPKRYPEPELDISFNLKNLNFVFYDGTDFSKDSKRNEIDFVTFCCSNVEFQVWRFQKQKENVKNLDFKFVGSIGDFEIIQNQERIFSKFNPRIDDTKRVLKIDLDCFEESKFVINLQFPSKFNFKVTSEFVQFCTKFGNNFAVNSSEKTKEPKNEPMEEIEIDSLFLDDFKINISFVNGIINLEDIEYNFPTIISTESKNMQQIMELITSDFIEMSGINKFSKLLIGLSPIKRMKNVGEGAYDFVSLPFQLFNSKDDDISITKGIKKGVLNFLKALTKETAGTTSDLFEIGSSLLSSTEQSTNTNEPQNITEGVKEGYCCVIKSAKDVFDLVLAIPSNLRVQKSKRTQSTVKLAFKLVPFAIVSPVQGFMNAFGKIFKGIENKFND